MRGWAGLKSLTAFFLLPVLIVYVAYSLCVVTNKLRLQKNLLQSFTFSTWDRDRFLWCQNRPLNFVARIKTFPICLSSSLNVRSDISRYLLMLNIKE